MTARSAYPVLFLGVAAVSLAAIFIRLAFAALPERGLAESVLIASGRLLVASVLVLPLALPARPLARDRRAVGLAALAGVFLALHFLFWIASLAYTSIAASTTIVTTNPVWIALAEAFYFKRRVARGVWLGIGLAVLGGAVIGLADAGGAAAGPAPLFGDLLALLGAWAVSLYFLLGREAQRALGTTGYVGVAYPAAALFLFPVPWLLGEGYLGHAPAFYLWVFLLAAVPQMLGHTSLNYAVQFLGPTIVTLFVLFEPVIASLAGYLFFGELPPAGVFAGALVLLIGVALAVRASGDKT